MSRIQVFIMTVAGSLLGLLQPDVALAQEGNAPHACRPWLDSLQTIVTMEEATAWADRTPLRVACDDDKIYTLLRFDISIFTRKPLQTREYGRGEEGGIPILARRALEQMNKGDAFILKNPVYLDAEGKEQPLPVISFELE